MQDAKILEAIVIKILHKRNGKYMSLIKYKTRMKILTFPAMKWHNWIVMFKNMIIFQKVKVACPSQV